MSNLNDANWWEVYVAAFYFAIFTMATIGYGDIHPFNYKEDVTAIMICILASTIFAYVMNSLNRVLTDTDDYSKTFNHKIVLINGFLRRNALKMETRSKINNYLNWLLSNFSMAEGFEE